MNLNLHMHVHRRPPLLHPTCRPRRAHIAASHASSFARQAFTAVSSLTYVEVTLVGGSSIVAAIVVVVQVVVAQIARTCTASPLEAMVRARILCAMQLITFLPAAAMTKQSNMNLFLISCSCSVTRTLLLCFSVPHAVIQCLISENTQHGLGRGPVAMDSSLSKMHLEQPKSESGRFPFQSSMHASSQLSSATA